MRRSGFTLIEMLVVVAITVAVAVAGFLGFTAFRNKQALKAGMDELRAAVEATKRRSVAQESGSRWGMRFTNATSGVSSYAVFKGSSYSTSGVDRLHSFREPVGFTNPSASSTYDLVFAPLSGALSENKVLTIVGGTDGLIGDLILRTIGSITARIDNGVVGYWHFDEGTSTLAYDASGNSNTGTLTNGPTWQSGSSCKAGRCLSFDGTNDHVQVARNSTLEPSSITVTAWFNTSDKTLNQRVVSKTESGDYQVSLNENSACGASTLCFLVYVSGTGYRAATYPASSLSNNTWYHVAGVYDKSKVYLYLNGTAVASTTQSGTVGHSTAPFCIGSEPGAVSCTAGQYFSGKIDEVRVYDRALSASEIEAFYNDLK